MKNSLLCLVVLGALLALAHAGRRNRKRGNDEGCSEWVREDCVSKGPCGRGTQKATRTGDSCEVKERNFRCRKPCEAGEEEGANRKQGRCKYSKRGAVKATCDPTTKTRSITLTLKKGGPECEATKTITRPCRQDRPGRSPGGRGRGKGKGCKYQKGEWSDCDETTNMMSRTLTLKKGDPTTCEATKTMSRKCKKEKCTFGPWSEFGDCQNGVKTKTRQVVSGGEGCQARTSKTKPCRH